MLLGHTPLPSHAAMNSAGARPLPRTANRGGRAAVFLDRDGVINVDHGFTFQPQDLTFTPTAVRAIGMLNRAAIDVVVVTNQSGVARGLFDLSAVERFHVALQDQLRRNGAWIDAFYVCPFHPEGVVAKYRRDHEDRKPHPGMLLRATRDRGISPAQSLLVGDRETDLEAARLAGVKGVMIERNHGDLEFVIRDWLARRSDDGY